MGYIEFPKLGIHLDINPIVVPNLFGTQLSIHWYGIIIAVAILVALTLCMRQSKKFNIKEEDLLDMFLIALPAAIVFARIFFVVFTLDNYKDDFWGIFKIWEGGLAIYGALIGAILSVYIYAKVKKIDMLELCDFACVYLPLAQAIGRWGNFTNQELYGTPTDLPWGMTGSRIGDIPVHPTFLYESVLNIIVFIILLRLRKNKKVRGSVLAVYLMLYSFVRFMMEFLRTDEFGNGNVRYNQIFAALVFIGSFIWLGYLTKRSNKLAEEGALASSDAYTESVEEIKEDEEEQIEEPVGVNVEEANQIKEDIQEDNNE